MSGINYFVNGEEESPMSMQITPEMVASVFEFIDKVSGFGKALAKLTKTTVDDKAIEFIEMVAGAVKPYVTEQWFADAVNYIVGLFVKGDKEAIKAMIGK